ncbi:uncharacterized protein LOC113233615 [Hyposmocoma kahamanoa]|uniref:uncharacterized protein LOC113233615 n=1 Tax=Hyposmocoma kahamanoa TaxID=1477025 RepID=UPI000E6D96B1|nr:uncharacterized protein LOC113233615 [Hyposmocoma kahamanoa]
MVAFLLLLLPALAIASIDIEITGQYDGDQPSLKVYYSGSQADVISNEERKVFKLGDEELKNAVRNYFGKMPDSAYLRSPTPWGDLYSTYDWSQVIRTLVPKSARILKITSEPQIVMQQVFENNGSKPELFNMGIYQDVQETVSSSSSHPQELNIGQDISYGFEIKPLNHNGKTPFSYTSKYGLNYKKSRTVRVGATSSMNLLLQAGQAAMATLEATRVTITLEIEYEANLSGVVAVNYDETYKGHNFWGLDVRGVMEKGNLNNKVRSKEVIEINYYVTSKVSVFDRAYGEKMMEVTY